MLTLCLGFTRAWHQGLLRLCALFERLLQYQQPQLVLHLQDIGVNPLQIAMPWISSAYSSALHPSEVTAHMLTHTCAGS